MNMFIFLTNSVSLSFSASLPLVISLSRPPLSKPCVGVYLVCVYIYIYTAGLCGKGENKE